MPILHRPTGQQRMALLYAVTLAGTGVSLPYIGLWFAAHGLSGAQIGVVLGAPMLARVVTSPAIALWADSFHLRRTPIAILALIAAAGYAALGVTHGIGWWLPIWFVAATALGLIAPLSDVLAIRAGRRLGFGFGIPRGIGSVAHVVGNVAIGAWLTRHSTDAVLIWIVTAAASAAVVARFVAPDEQVSEEAGSSHLERFKGLGSLFSAPMFLTAIVSVGLMQATHAFYYGFASLIWKQQGVPGGVIGLLWGSGVGAEIVFLWFAEGWRRRLGPWRLVMLSGVAGLIRWTAFAFSPPLWVIWPLQALHAFTFTAAYVGGLQIVEQLSPRRAISAAQTLSSALSGGLLIGLLTMASGALFDRFGSWGYLAMSLMELVALAGAWRLRAVLARDGAAQQPSPAPDNLAS